MSDEQRKLPVCFVNSENIWSQKLKQRDYEEKIKHYKESFLTNQIKFSEVNRLRRLKNSKTEAQPMCDTGADIRFHLHTIAAKQNQLLFFPFCNTNRVNLTRNQ